MADTLAEPTPPFIIDIEASGFAAQGYPIEVGVALDDGTTFCSLIDPPEQWTYWDEEAEKVHRVPRDILETYGRPVTEVVADLNRILEGKTAYSDAWEVDKPWLSALFREARVTQLFRFSTLEMILTSGQMTIWHETKDRVLIEMDVKRHRASTDAQLIQRTYLESL